MNQDFLDLLRAFIDGNVRFLVVGAYALGVHGRPRATGDLDVRVDPTPANAANIVKALEAFGAPVGQVTVDDFSRPGIVFQMGLPSTSRVDDTRRRPLTTRLASTRVGAPTRTWSASRMRSTRSRRPGSAKRIATSAEESSVTRRQVRFRGCGLPPRV